MGYIKHVLLSVNSTFSLREFILVVLMSVLVGCFIYFSYHLTHHNRASKLLIASIIVFSPIFACLDYAMEIENSTIGFVLAIVSMVAAALAVSKYNAKLNEDQLFLMWSAVSGILCGEKSFIIAAVLSIIIFAVFLVVKALNDDMARYLIIEGQNAELIDLQAIVFNNFNRKAKLLIKILEDDSSFKMVYLVSINKLEKLRSKRIDIISLLREVNGVKKVVIVKEEQLGEQ